MKSIVRLMTIQNLKCHANILRYLNNVYGTRRELDFPFEMKCDILHTNTEIYQHHCSEYSSKHSSVGYRNHRNVLPILRTLWNVQLAQRSTQLQMCIVIYMNEMLCFHTISVYLLFVYRNRHSTLLCASLSIVPILLRWNNYWVKPTESETACTCASSNVQFTTKLHVFFLIWLFCIFTRFFWLFDSYRIKWTDEDFWICVRIKGNFFRCVFWT